MNTSIKNKKSLILQVWHFFQHLRWHYQLFILSGGYLLGGLLSDSLDMKWYGIQFLNVHLLLFGGASAYNSFWDKDQGPIGGLKNPPEMSQWMWVASLILQMIGLFLSLPMGSFFTSIYVISMLFFWLYSTPFARWKGKPIKSMFAIGISTGVNSVLLGYLAAGPNLINLDIFVAAAGVAFILLSLYPISQSYQQEEDTRRGDCTFAIYYGKQAVFHFFEVAFLAGLLLITIILVQQNYSTGIFFGIIGLFTGLAIRSYLKSLLAAEYSYRQVMWVKYGTSFVFAVFLLTILILKHSGNIGM